MTETKKEESQERTIEKMYNYKGFQVRGRVKGRMGYMKETHRNRFGY